ncbi:hypothetical protein WA026_022560 [Henosepilachna vigintioctopunctata]|uniref:PKD/REJ-like domain-containing protein n=1 Tax=Henosepilachna vigintioctopunctata TaxID=420089 RepID=A0AAW1VJB9_9CUCU
MIIKGSNHLNEARYVVRLGIQSKWWTTITYAYQVINVRVKKREVYIECLGNCYTEYFDQRMTFKVECQPRCTETKWQWSVYQGSGDDQSLTSGPLQLIFSEEQGRSYDLLSFNGILPDKTYLLKVATDADNETQPSYKFKSLGTFDFSCNLQPFEGIILETFFYFKCSGKGYGSFFWVTFYQKDVNKEMILDYDSSWEYLNFTVPRRGVVSLRFAHYTGLEGEVNWDPDNHDDYFNLTDKELKLSEIEDSYNNGNESIKNSLEAFEYKKALNKMSLISKSVEKINGTDVKALEPVIDKIVTDLRKIPMATISNLEQASGIMEDLTSRNVAFDTDLTKKMSELCKDLSEHHKNTLGQQFLESVSDLLVLETTIKQLMQCSTGLSQPNETAIELHEAPVDVTTVNYLIIEGETNTEVYDEYLDEVISLENKEKYKTVTSDFFEICLNNGESLYKRINLRRPDARDTKDAHTEGYSITVSKRKGVTMAFRGYRAFGIGIDYPADLADSHDMYYSIICTTSQNIFWWEHGVDLISNVVIVVVSREDRQNLNFKNDFKISFKMKKEPTRNFPKKTYEISPKKSSKSDIPDENLLPVYIVAVDAGRSLMIEFSDIKDNVSLHVISTDFELPTGRHFSGDTQQITQAQKHFVDHVTNEYPGYRLISVSSGDSNQKDPIQFQMRAYSVSCLKYITQERMWNASCKAQYSTEKRKSYVCVENCQ